jgi:polyhydroxyalkanoate synthase
MPPDDGESRGLVESIRKDVQRSLFRARNGIKYVTGADRPKVGITPKDVIWTKEKARLYRYRSAERTREVPLLLVPSIVGRPYILDLRPNQSMAAGMLASGRDVLMIDWGEPGAVDSTNTIETYCDGYLPRVLKAAMRESGSDEIDVLGYCFGGVMSLLCVAGNLDLPVRNLIAMATPIDFTKLEGLIHAIRRGRIDVDELIDHTGNIPPDTVYRGFASLRPTSDIFKYAKVWDGLWNDRFMDSYQSLGQWLGDQVPFPGACAYQLADLLLRRNLLAEGSLPLGDRQVNLADIRIPVLNIMAEHDHLVPAEASEALLRLVGSSDKTELRVPGGHVGLIVGRDAARTTVPGILNWLEERST